MLTVHCFFAESAALMQTEEQLLARVCLMVNIYVAPGAVSTRMKGHCIAFPQKVEELARALPRLPSALRIVIIRKKGKPGKAFDFRVRREKVCVLAFASIGMFRLTRFLWMLSRCLRRWSI